MSSTTERAERGQVLVIFAFALVAILAVAALVFDVGQDLLDRRDQQNAADAAALAGARYLTDAGCQGTWTNAACTRAVAAAVELAQENGYVDGAADATVEVEDPPGPESVFAGYPGHIEVNIRSERPTFFGGIVGIIERQVGALGTAANLRDFSLEASLIALDPHACLAGHIAGNATVTVGGAIQVNSDCVDGALKANGSPTLYVNAPECNVVGDFSPSPPTANIFCPTFQSVNEGADPVPDPLASLKGPYWGTTPTPGAVVWSGPGSAKPSVGCPDGLPSAATKSATLAAPALCDIGAKDGIYRIFPGMYPGGIRIAGNNSGPPVVYIEPGIYYIAGGGLRVSGGDVEIRTVGTGGTTSAGGILIYNSEDPVFHEQCLADPGFTHNGASPCLGAINIGGNGSRVIHLEPYELDPYKNLLIYQERSIASQPSMQIDGEGRPIEISGTIYVPEGHVQITGKGDAITAQLISNTWKITGNGVFDVTYDADAFVKYNAIGLVE